MSLNIPTQYDPITISGFLPLVVSLIGDYMAAKVSLQALAQGGLTQATVAVGGNQVVVTDPTLLQQINTNAQNLLSALEAEYQTDLASVAAYLVAASAANVN
jgi:hypothetical protein